MTYLSGLGHLSTKWSAIDKDREAKISRVPRVPLLLPLLPLSLDKGSVSSVFRIPRYQLYVLRSR